MLDTIYATSYSSKIHRDGPAPPLLNTLTRVFVLSMVSLSTLQILSEKSGEYRRATTIIELYWFTSAHITNMHSVLFKHGQRGHTNGP
jgi:hypothetical protein